MYNPYEIETMARTQREEVARQVAAIRRAGEATRNRTTPRAWRRYLAAIIRAAAARIAPAAIESTPEPEPQPR